MRTSAARPLSGSVAKVSRISHYRARRRLARRVHQLPQWPALGYNWEMAERPSGVILPVVEYPHLPALRSCVAQAVSLGTGAIMFEDGGGERLDAFVLCAYFARRHPDVAFGVLLESGSGRPPSIVAKLVSGIDVLADGQAFVAIGDLDDRHVVASARDREATELVYQMLSSDSTTMRGRYFEVCDAWNLPRRTSREHLPAKVSRALSADRLVEDRNAGVPLPRAAFIHLSPTNPQAGMATIAVQLLGDVPFVVVETVDDPRYEAGPRLDPWFARWRSLPDLAEFAREVGE